MDWIDLADDRERSVGIVDLRVLYNARNFCLAEDLLASQEGLCTLGLLDLLHFIGLQFSFQ